MSAIYTKGRDAIVVDHSHTVQTTAVELVQGHLVLQRAEDDRVRFREAEASCQRAGIDRVDTEDLLSIRQPVDFEEAV